jgi:Domain of unknown function (DUF5667)
MTTLFRSRPRAEDFAARVDGTSSLRVAADPATERLVGLTGLLRDHGRDDPDARPRDAFAAELRSRLVAEAATLLTPQNAGLALPSRRRTKRERRLVAVASAAVLIGGTAGMAAAAQHALPGEALYPVKRGIEKAQTGLSVSSEGRGRDLLDQASDRLGEAQGLVDQNSADGMPQVPHTLEAFTTQAQQGADLLLASYQSNRDPETIRAVRGFAARALLGIEALTATAPADARPGLRDAALALRDIDARASGLCDVCADLPALSLPEPFLASAEVDRAMHRLQSARLNNDHPVIVPKQGVPQTRPAAGSRGGAALSQPAPAGSAATSRPKSSGAGQAPLPGLTHPAGPTAKPKLKVDLGGGTLGAGLGDTVETLLPDPTGDLLP